MSFMIKQMPKTSQFSEKRKVGHIITTHDDQTDWTFKTVTVSQYLLI